MATRPGYIYGGSVDGWVEIGTNPLTPVKYQNSAPTSPSVGDIWIDADGDVPSVDVSQFLRWSKTVTGGQTSLSGADDNALVLQYTPNYEQVYINGVLQVRGQDYIATTGTTITGLTALAAGDVVEVFSVVARTVADVYTQAQVNSLVSTNGLVLITSATIGSNVSSVTVNNAFSATYDAYKITITGGSGTSDTELYMQLGTTNTGYYETRVGAGYGSTGTPVYYGTTNGTRWTDVGTLRASNGFDVNVDIFQPFQTKNTHFSARRISTNNSFFVGGYLNSSISYTDFTILPISGTMTGGTIKVYGYK